jgi:hemolysin activation/secretion protein
VLSGVTLHGNTVFPSGELAPLYREYLGRRVGPDEIAQIVGRITARYREAGFFLSHAVASRQPLPGGMLDVRVIEGYVAKVTATSPISRLADAAKEYAADVTEDRPLRLTTLERDVLLIRDLPGAVFRPSIAPIDEAAGRYELVLTVDPKPLSGSFAVDNRGPSYEGPWEAEASAALASAAIPFDELSATFFTVPAEPRELIAGAVGYSFPLGSSGLRGSLAASRSAIHPGDYLAPADLDGLTDTYRAGLNYPLLRTRDQSLWLAASFDLIESRENIPEGNLYDDHLRVLRGEATYAFVDPWGGSTRAFAQVSEGLSGLGASNLETSNPSTPNGHAAFTKVAASLTHERPLFGDFAIFFDLAGQKSWQPLLVAEQFSLGGARFGRGYDPAELLGDDALAGTVELRYGHALDWALLRAFQLYAFYDLGAVWNHDPDNLPRRGSIASAGAGARLTLAQDLLLSLELVRPLTMPLPPNFHKPLRAFVRVSKTF